MLHTSLGTVLHWKGIGEVKEPKCLPAPSVLNTHICTHMHTGMGAHMGTPADVHDHTQF